MPPKKLLHAHRAARTFEANLTPRYRSLDALQAYVEGRQYAGLANWFDDSRPLLERAPCVVEPIVESALQSFGDFIFGEERFPGITSKVDEDDEAFDPEFGLNPEDSITLDRIIKNIFAQAEVSEISREALAQAQGSRSAVGICSVKDGKLCVDLESAKCCTPTFDPRRPRVIVKLEIRYPSLEEYWDAHDKAWAQRCMLFRRVIDDKSDITYNPIEAHESGEDPGPGAWSPQITIEHNFGFCPVVWYAHRKICTTRRDVDGISVNEKLSYCKICAPVAGYKKKMFKVVSPEMQQYYETNQIAYVKIPPHNPACEQVFRNDKPQILSPKSEFEYLISRKDPEPLQLQCRAGTDVSRIYWYIDNQFYKSGDVRTPLYFIPGEGPVKISCTDDKGINRDVWIRVKYVEM